MILLDTHALIWWTDNSEKLSQKALETINEEKKNNVILISSISVWEIYMLVSKKKLGFALDTEVWLSKIEQLSFIQFVPVNNTIAAKSVLLPGEFHNDPADRIIVATAREKGVSIITADERIRNYSHVLSIW